jgi:PAS domain S-box-containing protein
MARALVVGMLDHTLPAYEIDGHWQIVSANDAFCRIFQCTESSLRGRDVRELLRPDWRHDFRNYVARALVGVGSMEVSLPFVAPCGKQGWFKHTLEPLLDGGLLAGYRASLQPQAVARGKAARRWWDRRPAAFSRVWNADADQLAKAG